MARVKIHLTCEKCGCTFEHVHFDRNSAEASGYEKWARETITLCPTCYAEPKREAEKKEHESFIAGLNLPELEGTPKQIAWAEKIRNEWVTKSLMPVWQYRQKREKKIITLVLADVKSAKWWIDNRTLAYNVNDWQHTVGALCDEYNAAHPAEEKEENK